LQHLCTALALCAALALPSIVAAAPGAPPSPRPRIVSLVPSLTETLFAIGAGPQVAGVSQFTDFPPEAAALPVVSSFATIDTERIVRLRPDAVVGIAAQSARLAELRRFGFSPTLVPDDTFDDIFVDIDVLGRISGHTAQARALAARLRARTAALVASVPKGERPTVFVVIGNAPLFTVGDRSYIAHLITLAGGRNAAHDLPSAFGRYSEEALLRDQPDVIVADRASGIASVLDRAPWSALRAVQAHRVYILDDAALLERPGPRYNDGLEWLIDVLRRARTSASTPFDKLRVTRDKLRVTRDKLRVTEGGHVTLSLSKGHVTLSLSKGEGWADAAR
jgi:iron complex transport system substrate-binding protein